MHGIAGVLTPCVANGLEAARDADLLVRNALRPDSEPLPEADRRRSPAGHRHSPEQLNLNDFGRFQAHVQVCVRPIRGVSPGSGDSERPGRAAPPTPCARQSLHWRQRDLSRHCAAVGSSCGTRAMSRWRSPKPGRATRPVRGASISGHVHSVRCRCISSRVRPDMADPLAHLLAEDRVTESALWQETLSCRCQMGFGPGARAGAGPHVDASRQRTGRAAPWRSTFRRSLRSRGSPADLVIRLSPVFFASQRLGLAFSRSPSRTASCCSF